MFTAGKRVGGPRMQTFAEFCPDYESLDSKDVLGKYYEWMLTTGQPVSKEEIAESIMDSSFSDELKDQLIPIVEQLEIPTSDQTAKLEELGKQFDSRSFVKKMTSTQQSKPSQVDPRMHQSFSRQSTSQNLGTSFDPKLYCCGNEDAGIRRPSTSLGGLGGGLGSGLGGGLSGGLGSGLGRGLSGGLGSGLGGGLSGGLGGGLGSGLGGGLSGGLGGGLNYGRTGLGGLGNGLNYSRAGFGGESSGFSLAGYSASRGEGLPKPVPISPSNMVKEADKQALLKIIPFAPQIGEILNMIDPNKIVPLFDLFEKNGYTFNDIMKIYTTKKIKNTIDPEHVNIYHICTLIPELIQILESFNEIDWETFHLFITRIAPSLTFVEVIQTWASRSPPSQTPIHATAKRSHVRQVFEV